MITYERAVAARACKEALDKLLEHGKPVTIQEVADCNPAWALWTVGKMEVEISPELFADCAKKSPRAALGCASKSKHMTPELFATCAKRDPGAALIYAAESEHWTPELLSACAQQSPWVALTYASLSEHMTPELRKELEE